MVVCPGYHQLIREHPLLSRDQEILLAQKMSLGDEQARASLICSNVRFAISLALPYSRSKELDDLVQEALEGMIGSADKYRHQNGKFSVYASYWIKNRLRRYTDKSQTVNLPFAKSVQCRKDARKRDRENAEFGESSDTTISPIKITSLNTILESGTEWIDLFQGASAEDIVHNTHIRSIRDKISKYLNQLPKSHKRVLIGSFYEYKTADEMAEEFSLTRRTVIEYKRRGMKQLRQMAFADKSLREYWT